MCFVFQNLRIEMQLQRMKQRFMQSYNETLKSRKLLQSLFAMPTNQSQKHTLNLNQKQNNNKKRKEKNTTNHTQGLILLYVVVMQAMKQICSLWTS